MKEIEHVNTKTKIISYVRQIILIYYMLQKKF